MAKVPGREIEGHSESSVQDSVAGKTELSWQKRAMAARHPSEIAAIVFEYYDVSTNRSRQIQGMGFDEHGQVVFSLLQASIHAKYLSLRQPGVTKSAKQALHSRLVFENYIIGMSLAKLNSHVKEPIDIQRQKDWVGFGEFLSLTLDSGNFKYPDRKVAWTPKNLTLFFDIEKRSSAKVTPALQRRIQETPFDFDSELFLLVHNMIKKLLENIFNVREKIFVNAKGGQKTTELKSKKEHFGGHLSDLANALLALTEITRLPSLLDLYITSIIPRRRTVSSTTEIRTVSSTTEIDKDDQNDYEYDNELVIDEENSDTDTMGPDSLDQDFNGQGIGGIRDTANHDSTLQDLGKKQHGAQRDALSLSLWHNRYKQWIKGIIRQSRAATQLVDLRATPRMQKLKSMTFKSIRADPPSIVMEDWRMTVSRVLQKPVDESERLLSAPLLNDNAESRVEEHENERERALAVLRDLANHVVGKEPYSWLNNWKFGFGGTYHCEAMIAINNIAELKKADSSRRNPNPVSKIGVSRQCCTVCSFLLEEVCRYRGAPMDYVYSACSGRVWKCTLPVACPPQIVKSVSQRLDDHLRKALLRSIPYLEYELAARRAKVPDSPYSQKSGSSAMGDDGENEFAIAHDERRLPI